MFFPGRVKAGEAGAPIFLEFVSTFCKLLADPPGALALFVAFTSGSSGSERRRGSDFCIFLRLAMVLVSASNLGD